ncbi:anti-anti-sigma factor [Streptosporangium subroseum]|uniref:Anti-anti-sigma factor n=1 Tax=Streptosporangium subroseum TaxID=106412 RepID=A0A239P9X5_9ACTN|nr:STAS domain-containing protein [Streptosporangium subroseum]SNT63831.1 anti-anti-sigma factor [Streptosporangium subroseum]
MGDTNGATCAPIYDDGTLRITSTVHPPGIRLEGELDRSGVPALMAALAGAAHTADQDDGPFYADLSELDFIDVNGLRVLITAGLGMGGSSAGVVRMVTASVVVLRLLRLTGWDEAPGWDQAPAVRLDEAQPDAGAIAAALSKQGPGPDTANQR